MSIALDDLPKPGDIALVLGGDITSKVSVLAQSLVSFGSFKDEKISHAALCLSGECWIEATPPKVRLALRDDVFGPGSEAKSWRIFRRNGMSQQQSGADTEFNKWLDAALPFLGEKYNRWFKVPKISALERSSFCSELVAKVYQRAGVDIGLGKKPEQVIPLDLYQLFQLDSKNWREVTAGYTGVLSSQLSRSQHALRERQGELKRGRETLELIAKMRIENAILEADNLLSKERLRASQDLLSARLGLPCCRRPEDVKRDLDRLEKDLNSLKKVSWELRPEIRKRLSTLRKLRAKLPSSGPSR